MSEDSDDFGESGEEIRSAVAQRPLLSSATDLLISWLPQSEDSSDTASSNEIWDRYFGNSGRERLSVPTHLTCGGLPGILKSFVLQSRHSNLGKSKRLNPLLTASLIPARSRKM